MYFNRLLYFSVALLLCVAVTSASRAQSSGWPTKEFLIVQSDPYSMLPDSLQSHHQLTDDEQTALTDMEVFLTEVAERYEHMGFRAPELERVEGVSGGEAYKVHFFDYDDHDTSSFRVRRKSGSTTEMQIDASRSFQKDGVPLDRTYEHLAHELFHLVQRAYQPSANVIQNDWIIEGQAQAMGMHMLQKVLRKDPYAGSQDGYRLGARPYYTPLQDIAATRVPKADYLTASFWRYVGEVFAASKKNGRAGVEPIEPDYRYLVDMFQHPYPASASLDADLLWADQGLRNVLGYGLDRVYANFVSTFAAYVPARLTKEPEHGADNAEINWRNFVFGGCGRSADLTATSISADIELVVDANAASCFTVNVWGEGQAGLSLQIHSGDADALAALRIGTLGGVKVGSPVLVAPLPGGGYLGHWRFSVEAGEPAVFIISNVAANPTKTRKVLLSLNASSDFWESDMTQPRQVASARGGSAASPAAMPLARDRTREQAAKEFAEGLDTLSNRSSNSVGVSHNYEVRGCVGQAFAESGCGPTTSIHLTLMPGAFADGFQTTGTGGGLAQVMSQFIAMADNGAFATDRGLRDAFGEAADMEGSYVHIRIPAIDYGFTGTFTEAIIGVNGGKGRGEFEARGPADLVPGRGRLFPHTGTVTIEEFTPSVLRGSFSGQLTDLSSVDFTAFGDDQALPVQRQIQGRFAITAPWEGDKRVTVYSVLGGGDGNAMADLYEVFPAARNFDIEALTGIDPSTISGSGSGYSVGMLPVSEITELPVCSCECRIDRNQPRACLKVCKPKILACGQANQLVERFGASVTAQSHPVSGTQSSSSGDPVRPTRDEYIRGLIDNGYPPDRIDFLVGEMDAFMAENGGWAER